MDTPQPADRVSASADTISRRDVVIALGASGLTLTLLAHGSRSVAAQEATPAAAGLPPGVALAPLIQVPLEEIPTAPITLALTRLTMEPGVSVPESSVPDILEIAYVEEGTLICPGAEGRTVYGPDGTELASGAGELEVPTGGAIVVPPNVVDGARNDGDVVLSVLLIDLAPGTDAATPAM